MRLRTIIPCVAIVLALMMLAVAPGLTPPASADLATTRVYLPLVSRPHSTVWQCTEPANNTRTGACGPLVSGQPYQQTISSSADKYDWFYLDMAAAHTIETWLTNIPAGCNYDLILTDAQGTPLTSGALDQPAGEHILWGPVAPGRYYLVVERIAGWNASASYTLRATFEGPPAPPTPTVPAPTPPPEGTKVHGQTGITLVYVRGGEFWMGSADSDPDAYADEKPLHRVYLDGYWMGRTEVTNAQYRRFVDANGYNVRGYWSDAGWAWKAANSITRPYYWDTPPWNGAEYPVVGVSWYEVEAYANWAGLRLPTEAQWEYAARGGPLSRGYRYAGSDSVDAVAWYWSNSGGGTRPVAQKAPNELGLYDMSGNVQEWVADWYAASYYAQSPGTNPLGPGSGIYKALRGGSWFDYARSERSAFRSGYDPSYRLNKVGFRVAE